MSAPPALGITIESGDWTRLGAEAYAIRLAVFVEEQGVPLALEQDEHDRSALHVLARREGVAVGTGRLLPDGHIGRLAVLADRRGQGIGRLLLGALMLRARERGQRELVLHAQCAVADFYARHGFVAEGPPFMEAGISHLLMRHRVDQGGQRK